MIMLRETLGKIIKIPLNLYLNLNKAFFFLLENDITERQKKFSFNDFFLSVSLQVYQKERNSHAL